MIKFVETQTEFDEFIGQFFKYDSIVYIMPTDNQLHPLMDRMSFVYVSMNDDEWVLGFNHTDISPFNLIDIWDELIKESKVKRWVFDKKGSYQRLKLSNMYDIDSYTYLNGSLIDYLSYFEPLYHHYRSVGIHDVLNSEIPIMKLIECIRMLIHDVGDLTHVPRGFKWYNETVIPMLCEVEKGGLHVDSHLFLQRFSHINGIDKLVHDEVVYTQYNPFTLTTRPSNHHGGVNYSALNKTDGTREIFTTRHHDNGSLLQFDFDGYHLRLIADMIGYKLPNSSVHEYFAEQYGCTYDESKQRSFKNLYGGVSDEDKDIPYFKLATEYIKQIHSLSKLGKLYTPIGDVRIKYDPNPLKVFNYYLQAYETEQSILAIRDILLVLEGHVSKLVLYTYDSFLIDYFYGDGITLAKELKITIGKNWKVKATYGNNYSEL